MKKTLILALAATGLTAGGVAAAQDRPQRNAEITRADAETRAERQFARMDANGDGMINEADQEARVRARFDRVDADGNGSISFEEYTAVRENRAERRGDRAERRGRRGGDRMAMRGHRGGRGGPGLAGLMRQNADADGDGSISQAEFTAAALTRFQRQDADGDGTVTAEERRAHREAMREVRRAHQAQNAE